MSNAQIAGQLDTSRNTVSLWRQRWWAHTEVLNVAQAAGEGDPALRQRMVSMLGDAPRPGTPSDFSAEQLTQIISVACESPEDSGRPVTHWTPRELTDEVIKRGIVENISPRTVGRFLKEADLKPHRSIYWLNHQRAQNPEAFDGEVKDVCETYRQAPTRHEQGVHTVSCDE
jgi:transposase